jgi:Thermopsin
VSLLLIVPTSLMAHVGGSSQVSNGIGSGGAAGPPLRAVERLPEEPAALLGPGTGYAAPPTLPHPPGVHPEGSPTPGSPSGRSAALLPAAFPSDVSGRTGYPSPPAPMGLADLGSGESGAYGYNTTGFLGTVSVSSFSSYTPGYPSWLDAPDWVTLSLDTVAVGLPINGSKAAPPSGTFWTENAVRFNGSEVQFEENIWNFSAPDASVAPTTFVSGAPLALSPVNGVAYYQRWGPEYPVSFPLSLTLENALGFVAGRPVVYFNFSVSSTTTSHTGVADEVSFNATEPAGNAPQFMVNGSGLNPYGLRDDAELVFTGDGDGSNANVVALNGSAALDRETGSGFVAVPSAYDYGDDSGGTSEGIASYYLGSTEYLHAGPSLLYGLWNTSDSALGPSAASGWIRVHVTLDPVYALLLATNLSADDSTAAGNFSFAPTAPNGTETTYLPPPGLGEPYVFEGWADGYDSAAASVAGNASGNVSLALPSDPGAYPAPLYLVGADQVEAFGESGGPGVGYEAGTNALSLTGPVVSLAAPYRQLNDYLYPAFDLFSVSDLAGGTVNVDGLLENASSYDATVYGTTTQLPGVTLDYSFDNVSGNSSVEDLSLDAPSTSTVPYGQLTEVPAVEIEAAVGARVSNITSNGTVGVVVVGSVGVSVSNASTTYAGTAVDLNGDRDTQLMDLDVRWGGTAVVANDSENLSVDRVTVGGGDAESGGYGIWGSALANVTLVDWTITCPSAPSRTGGFPPYNATCAYGGWLNGGNHLAIENLTSINASGINLGNWTDLHGSHLTAVGYEAEDLTNVNDCTDGVFQDVIASDGALAFYHLGGDSDFAFRNLTANVGGNVVAEVGYSTEMNFSAIRLSDQSGGVEGAHNSSDIVASDILATTGSEGVGGTNLTNLSVTGGAANSGSVVVLALQSHNVTTANLSADNGSVAVSLSGTDWANVSGIRSSDRSVGLSWWTGTSGSVADLSASNDSADAQLAGVRGVTVTGLSEFNERPGPSYFFNNFSTLIYPDGPLETYSDPGLVVSNVTALNCSFALQDVYSRGMQISDIRSWGSGTAIEMNGTQYASVEGLFAESDAHGLLLNSVLNITVTASTIEDSTGQGVYLTDGQNITFYGDNFVANDGASALGVYNPAFVQVGVYLALGVNFTWDGVGNYWSDWPNEDPYPVAVGVFDRAPALAFLTSWLSFVADGLAPGARWTVAVASHSYTASAPLVVIPSWVLPAGTLSFGVEPPIGWGVSPRAGAVAFTGGNESVLLTFTLPEYVVQLVATGLPSGTSWSASLAGTSDSTVTSEGPSVLSFIEPNGTYRVSVTPVPGYAEGTIGPGSELIVNGANRTVAVPFTEFTYPLSLEESGLPAGTVWGATVDGAFEASNASLLAWNEPNGSFPYSLSAIPGWHENSLPYHGTFVLAHRTLVVALTWFRVRYSVTFSESGLPNGTAWTVVFDGQNVTLTGSSIAFPVANGSYPYRVFATLPTASSGTPLSGNLTVSGNATSVALVFQPSRPTTPGSATLWSVPTLVVLAVVAVVGIGVAFFVVRAYLRRPPPEEPELHGEDLPRVPPPSRPRPGA